MYRLLDSSLSKKPELLNLDTISSAVLLSSLSITQLSSAAEYARVLARLTKHDPRVWTDFYTGTGKKAASKRLSQFLGKSSQRGPAAYWDEIKALLLHVPQSILLPSEEISDHNFSVFEALRDGITNRDESRSNQPAAWNAYLALVERFLSFPGVERDRLIKSTVMPMLVQYITPSRETSSWTVSASEGPTMVYATRIALASHESFICQWRKLSETLIQDMQTSLPEQSKDFGKSQDAIAAKASRWYNLQAALGNVQIPQEIKSAMTDATISETQSAITLVKARNGKPYGAAHLIECAVRSMPDLLLTQPTLTSLIANFLTTDLPSLLFSPSGPIFTGLLPSLRSVSDTDHVFQISLKSVLEAPESSAKNRILQAFVASPCLAQVHQDQDLLAKLTSSLEQAMYNDAEQNELLVTAIANPNAPEQLTHNLLSRMIENLDIDERQSASLSGLETVATYNHNAIKVYGASEEGSTLLTKLIPLTETSDNTVSQRMTSLKNNIQAIVSTDPAQAYLTRLQILRRNLGTVEGDALPMSSLISVMHEALSHYDDEGRRASMAKDLLPDETCWDEALRPVLSTRPNPSLAIMNDLATTVFLVEPTSPPTAVSFDKAGLSAAFRVFWFTYALIGSCKILEYATSDRRTCTYKYLFLVSALASDKLSIDTASSLWQEHGPEPGQSMLNVIMETQKLLGSLLAETPVNTSIPDVLSKLLADSRGRSAGAYYNSRAYISVATEMVSHHTAMDYNKDVNELRAVKDSSDVFAGLAIISAVQDVTTLTRTFNELLASLTGRDLKEHPNSLPNMVMLNSILNNVDFSDALAGIPKQRLVFFAQHASAQLTELHHSSESNALAMTVSVGLEAEIMRAFNQIFPVLKETYGSFWEDVLLVLTETWLSEAEMWDERLPLIHASLRLYSTLQRLGFGESNDDLVDALKSHEESAAEGMVNVLKILQHLPDDSHDPRKIVNELLARLIFKAKNIISPKSSSELFPILASESIALQRAAYEILHFQIPKEQEEISVEKALSKDYTAKLPEELLSLIIEGPTQDSIADATFKRTMPPILQGYMLSWHLVFDHWNGASDAVKNDYVNSIKEGSYIHGLLHFASDFLITSRTRPVDASKFEVETYRPGEDAPEKDAQWFLIHLYYLALKHLPTLSKTWWRDHTSRQSQTLVESWTEKYISSYIIASELHAVSSWAKDRESNTEQPMTVKISTSTREITASIPIDEQAMSIAINLPPSYPLSRATVSGLHRVGVTEQKWRSWIITTQGVINFSDIGGGGQLIDGLMAWRKNVTATLKGQTECAICYSVVSADKQLPTKRCGTCKNLFHGSCLFKWFKSSNSSSCPLCRNQFSYA